MALMPESSNRMEPLSPEKTARTDRCFSKSLFDQLSEWPHELSEKDPFEEHLELCVDIEIQKVKAKIASEIKKIIIENGQTILENVKKDIRALGYLAEDNGELNLEVSSFELFRDSNSDSIEFWKNPFHSRSASECLARTKEEVEKRMGSLRSDMADYANASLNQVYRKVLNTLEPMVVYNRRTYSQPIIVNESNEINPNSGRVSLYPIAIKMLSSEWSDEELE